MSDFGPAGAFVCRSSPCLRLNSLVGNERLSQNELSFKESWVASSPLFIFFGGLFLLSFFYKKNHFLLGL